MFCVQDPAKQAEKNGLIGEKDLFYMLTGGLHKN